MEREGTGLIVTTSAAWRTSVLAKHFAREARSSAFSGLRPAACLSYSSPESNSERPIFDKEEMRYLLDGHNIPERDLMYDLPAVSFSVLKRGGAIQFFGTKRHHDKWLQKSEDCIVRGCFAMTELGHGSNVCGIETLTTYDPETEEFVINTPCESAQKYWIGGAAKECREACGGQGLKSDNRVGAAKTECDVQLTFEGDNNVLMQQVSKALLGDYFSAQRKGKPLKGLGLDHINGPCPIIPSVLDINVLRNKNFQLALFQLREQSLLELLSAKVKKLLLKGVSMTDAVIVDVLGLMRTLYVLSAADQGPVFIRYGYLSTTQSQLIAEEVAALCAEVWPHALNLVHSFGIPQSLLGPIASNWIEYNSWANVQQ